MIALILVAINCVCFAYGWILTERQIRSESLLSRRLYQQPNMNTFDTRKRLIYGNFVGVCVVAAVAFSVFGFMFSLSTQFPIWQIAVQLLIIMLIDDAWFYTCHRMMHVNHWLFKHIHAIHHRVRSPLPLDFLYVHPAEWMLGAIGILLGVCFVYVVFGSVNAYALFVYSLFRPLHEIHIHSGLPSKVTDRLKHMGSSEHHGAHHAKLKGNYASTFKWLDRILKTHLVEKLQ